MSIFSSSACEDVSSDFNKNFARPKKKKDMSHLKEQISDLKASYQEAKEDGDYMDAKVIAEELCSKEKKLISLIDGY
ncbi:hypothetical protein [Sulfurimonas sp.]|uniref:hypothetical protein n=1 Tax=Sulfurimonas sp. TaxID=2022749 RepID=UPI002B4A4708|nr:hypothetical protein [Sulfurimonas sp.]